MVLKISKFIICLVIAVGCFVFGYRLAKSIKKEDNDAVSVLTALLIFSGIIFFIIAGIILLWI